MSGMKVPTAKRKHKHSGPHLPKPQKSFEPLMKDFMINYLVENL